MSDITGSAKPKSNVLSPTSRDHMAGRDDPVAWPTNKLKRTMAVRSTAPHHQPRVPSRAPGGFGGPLAKG